MQNIQNMIYNGCMTLKKHKRSMQEKQTRPTQKGRGGFRFVSNSNLELFPFVFYKCFPNPIFLLKMTLIISLPQQEIPSFANPETAQTSLLKRNQKPTSLAHAWHSFLSFLIFYLLAFLSSSYQLKPKVAKKKNPKIIKWLAPCLF